MRIIAIAIFALLAVFTHSTIAADPPSTQPVDNDKWGVPSRPIRFTSNNIFNNWGNPQQVIKDIRSTDADVVMLQEVPDADFEGIKKSLDYPYGFYAPDINGGPNVNKNSKSRGIAILSRFPLTETGPMPRGPGGGTKAVWAVAHVDGVKFVVASTHLSATSSPRLSVVAESMGWRVGEMKDTLSAWRERGKPPFVIGGDFNQPPVAELYQLMTAEWTDALKVLGKTEATHIERGISLRIDYILCTKEWTPQDAEVLPKGGSDHQAIRLTAGPRASSSSPANTVAPAP